MANAIEILVERVIIELIEQQPGIESLQLVPQDSDDTAKKDRIVVRATSGTETDEPSEGASNLPGELEVEVETRIQKRSSALTNAALSAIRNGVSKTAAQTPFTLSAFDYFEVLPLSGERSAERESRVTTTSFRVLARISQEVSEAGYFLMQDGTALLLQSGEYLLLQSGMDQPSGDGDFTLQDGSIFNLQSGSPLVLQNA